MQDIEINRVRIIISSLYYIYSSLHVIVDVGLVYKYSLTK